VSGFVGTHVTRQWLSSRHLKAVTHTHATIEELSEAAFSVRSVPKRYNKDHLPLRDSLETEVRSVGGWCEMAASPEPEERPFVGDVTRQRSEDRD
jgi:hypothetical protein